MQGFETNCWDRCTFSTPAMGRPASIKIRHDNSGNRPGWHLGAVALRNLQSNEVSVFIADRWLAVDEADKRTEANIGRSQFGWRRYIPPYSDIHVWNHETVGSSKASAKANASTGMVGVYSDAWVGGSKAQAAVGVSFSAPAAEKVFVRYEIVYTGGSVNSFLASFSELNCYRLANQGSATFHIQSAFSGSTVADKVISLAGMVGSAGTSTVYQALEVLGTLNDIYNLLSALDQLRTAGNAKTLSDTYVFNATAGANKFRVGFESIATALATGSSMIITAGQVRSIEMVGGIDASVSAFPTLAPPSSSTPKENSGVPGSGPGRVITPK
jgi:hypothetical protein